MRTAVRHRSVRRAGRWIRPRRVGGGGRPAGALRARSGGRRRCQPAHPDARVGHRRRRHRGLEPRLRQVRRHDRRRQSGQAGQRPPLPPLRLRHRDALRARPRRRRHPVPAGPPRERLHPDRRVGQARQRPERQQRHARRTSRGSTPTAQLADGFEASGKVAPGSHTVRAHVLRPDESEDAYQSVDNIGRADPLELVCAKATPTPTPTPTPTGDRQVEPTATPTATRRAASRASPRSRSVTLPPTATGVGWRAADGIDLGRPPRPGPGHRRRPGPARQAEAGRGPTPPLTPRLTRSAGATLRPIVDSRGSRRSSRRIERPS